MEKLKFNSLEKILNLDKENLKKTIDLSKEVQPISLSGKNVGFFGVTGAGKSSLINSCIGQKLCEEGENETTTIIKSVKSKYMTFWDIPGQTDEIKYTHKDYISLAKSLSFIGVVVTNTPNQIINFITLLESLNLKYYIIKNKFDLIEKKRRV